MLSVQSVVSEALTDGCGGGWLVGCVAAESKEAMSLTLINCVGD